MPSKVGHRRITIATGIVAVPVVAIVVGWNAVPFAVGVAVTYWPQWGPDLDHNRRRFGVLGRFMGLEAYSKLIPHRAGLRKKHWTRLNVWNIMLLSHIPWLGTAPRTLLLLLPTLLILLLFGWWWDYLFLWVWWLWLGMGYSDLWHVAADIITGDLKEAKRSYWYGYERSGSNRRVYLPDR